MNKRQIIKRTLFELKKKKLLKETPEGDSNKLTSVLQDCISELSTLGDQVDQLLVSSVDTEEQGVLNLMKNKVSFISTELNTLITEQMNGNVAPVEEPLKLGEDTSEPTVNMSVDSVIKDPNVITQLDQKKIDVNVIGKDGKSLIEDEKLVKDATSAKLKVVKIQIREKETPKERGVIYIDEKDYNDDGVTLDDLKTLLPQALKAVVAKYPDFKFQKIGWSSKAGCSCGCSPGFITTPTLPCNVWVDYTVNSRTIGESKLGKKKACKLNEAGGFGRPDTSKISKDVPPFKGLYGCFWSDDNSLTYDHFLPGKESPETKIEKQVLLSKVQHDILKLKAKGYTYTYEPMSKNDLGLPYIYNIQKKSRITEDWMPLPDKIDLKHTTNGTIWRNPTADILSLVQKGEVTADLKMKLASIIQRSGQKIYKVKALQDGTILVG